MAMSENSYRPSHPNPTLGPQSQRWTIPSTWRYIPHLEVDGCFNTQMDPGNSFPPWYLVVQDTPLCLASHSAVRHLTSWATTHDNVCAPRFSHILTPCQVGTPRSFPTWAYTPLFKASLYPLDNIESFAVLGSPRHTSSPQGTPWHTKSARSSHLILIFQQGPKPSFFRGTCYFLKH